VWDIPGRFPETFPPWLPLLKHQYHGRKHVFLTFLKLLSRFYVFNLCDYFPTLFKNKKRYINNA